MWMSYYHKQIRASDLKDFVSPLGKIICFRKSVIILMYDISQFGKLEVHAT